LLSKEDPLAFIEEKNRDVFNFVETEQFRNKRLFMKDALFLNYNYKVTSVRPNHILHGLDLTLYNGVSSYYVYNIPFTQKRKNLDPLSLFNKLTPYVSPLNDYYISYTRPRWTAFFSNAPRFFGFQNAIFFFDLGYIFTFQTWFEKNMGRRAFFSVSFFQKRKARKEHARIMRSKYNGPFPRLFPRLSRRFVLSKQHKVFAFCKKYSMIRYYTGKKRIKKMRLKLYTPFFRNKNLKNKK
jgi:hypothetical protein